MTHWAVGSEEDTFRQYAEYARGNTDRSNIWVTYVDCGLLALTMPEAFGGYDRGLNALVTAFEGLAYGGADAGMLFAVGAQILSVQYPLLKFGTQAQKDALLRPLVTGKLRAAHAATEPEAGSSIFGLRTQAIACPNGFRLKGTKRYITSAPVADVALVIASTDPQRGMWGLSAFVVDMQSPGVIRSANKPKMGLQSAPFGEILFDDCFVPDTAMLGRLGGGAAIFNFALDYERAFILAPALGIMRSQLEQSVRAANDRRQGERTLGSFQAVSNRIADMAMRLELARLAVYDAAARKQRGESSKTYSPIVKLAVSEFYLTSSLDAVRVAGAAGYMAHSPPEENLRDAIGSLFYSGTADVLRNLIARQNGVTDA